jgi:2-(1,2-epoxy-1,2-dihydrophenyl)acetyl-CoA isomerase
MPKSTKRPSIPGNDANGLVRYSVANKIATITLNRPEKLNAFTEDMRERLAVALDTVAARADVRVVAITGAGRAFCSGGDVKHMAALQEMGAGFEALQPLLEAGRTVIEKLAALPIPTLAAINGPAAGAGLNLALACDLRVASDAAIFSETFVKIGLHPDWGGTFHLPLRVGLASALELCWLGDSIDAAEALRLRLVNRVLAAAEFGRGWRALAARLAASPVASVRAAKRTLGAAAGRSLAECLDAEAEAQRVCWESADSAEGLRAFVERRAPVFAPETPAIAAGRRAWRFE